MVNFPPKRDLDFLYTIGTMYWIPDDSVFDSYALWDGFVVIQKEAAWIFLKDPLKFWILTQVFARSILMSLTALTSLVCSRFYCYKFILHIKDR